jgi:hypothetical protein
MSPEAVHQIPRTLEEESSRPSAIEFEMAYQARVAIDRIKFAIGHTEQFGERTDQTRDAGLQLLDALQRLETVDRRFQERCRRTTQSATGHGLRERENRHDRSDGETGDWHPARESRS